MDKRWILILIILIVGLGTMYYIVDNSNTVGSAITTFGKTTITLPENFSVVRSNDDIVELHNKKNSEEITIFEYGKQNTVKKDILTLSNEIQQYTEYDNISNSTDKINDVNILSIYLQNENGTDRISGFYNNNHTYFIFMNNYTNMNKSDADLKFILDTMTPDYKQSQD